MAPPPLVAASGHLGASPTAGHLLTSPPLPYAAAPSLTPIPPPCRRPAPSSAITAGRFLRLPCSTAPSPRSGATVAVVFLHSGHASSSRCARLLRLGSTSAPPFSSASPGRRPPVRRFLHRLRPETAVFSLAGQPAYPDPVSLLDRDNSDPLFGSADDDVYDHEDDNLLRPAFPELEAAVDAAIADPVGAALHKFNWSAPKDATFMSADTTLCCTYFAEVAMLLCSSDYVAHDLVCARPSCQDFVRAKGVRQNARPPLMLLCSPRG